MSADETVLTSRRALLHAGGHRWTPGRLRISDRLVRFTAHDGAAVEVLLTDLAAVRLVREPRRTLLLETPDGPLRLRCFAVAAVARLLQP